MNGDKEKKKEEKKVLEELIQDLSSELSEISDYKVFVSSGLL